MKQKGCFVCLIFFSLRLSAESINQFSTTEIGVSQTGWQADGYLRVEQMGYPTELPESPDLSESNLLSARVNLGFLSDKYESKFDFVAGQYLDTTVNELGVYELYAARIFNNGKSQVSLGRKREHWNQTDSDFNLGLWQPNWAIDSLRTEEQGLSGIFLKTKIGPFQFLALASPLFVPTMGPALQEDDGKLEPLNRWVRSPSNISKIRDRTRPLIYSIKVPDYSELVNKPGAAARIMFGETDSGFWATVGYARKPVNSLMLKYDAQLVLTESQGTVGEAIISPVVGYHNLTSADVGYGSESWMVSASFLADSPQDLEVPGESIQQKLSAINVMGWHFDQKLNLRFLRFPLKTQLGFMKVSGGQIRDFDATGAEQGALFDSRVLFTNAGFYKLGFETRLFQKKIISNFKYLRDWDQQGSIVSAEFQFYPAQQMSLLVGADALGPDSTENRDTDTRFINQFRANDRVYGGMTYVF